MKGTTKSGFEYEISAEIGDDYEFLELCVDLTENVLLMPRVVAKLLGPDQKARLMEHCRTESGRVSTERVMAETFEMIESARDVKK